MYPTHAILLVLAVSAAPTGAPDHAGTQVSEALGATGAAHLPAALSASVPPKSGPVLCEIPRGGNDGGFYVVASPRTRCPKRIEPNEPIYAVLECTPGAGYVTCMAWPEVYPVQPGDEYRLSYQWTVRVGWNTSHYPPSHTSAISFACPGIETVSVTVQVSNGSASDFDITGLRCGDDPR